MSDKPTKQWIENQIRALEAAMFQNQGAVNLLKAMLEKGVFSEEEKQNVA